MQEKVRHAKSGVAVACLTYTALVISLVIVGFPMTLLCVLGGYLFASLLGELVHQDGKW